MFWSLEPWKWIQNTSELNNNLSAGRNSCLDIIYEQFSFCVLSDHFWTELESVEWLQSTSCPFAFARWNCWLSMDIRCSATAHMQMDPRLCWPYAHQSSLSVLSVGYNFVVLLLALDMTFNHQCVCNTAKLSHVYISGCNKLLIRGSHTTPSWNHSHPSLLPA